MMREGDGIGFEAAHHATSAICRENLKKLIDFQFGAALLLRSEIDMNNVVLGRDPIKMNGPSVCGASQISSSALLVISVLRYAPIYNGMHSSVPASHPKI